MSDGIEIEIGVPAQHVTEIDHDDAAHRGAARPEQQGQRFVHNVGSAGEFVPFRLPGFVARDTTIGAGTRARSPSWWQSRTGRRRAGFGGDADILYS
ncbi:MAG: hypothetical protein U1E16_04680 [Hyphomicrobiales bacterium]